MAEVAQAEKGEKGKTKRVVLPKPDKNELQLQSEALQNEITSFQNESKEIKVKMDKIFNDRSGSRVRLFY
jgi:uncharacterized protein YlxW (UPF0749 family)